MIVPFKFRIKWIRFKSWLSDRWSAADRTHLIILNRGSALVIFLLLLAFLLSSCGSIQVRIETGESGNPQPSQMTDPSMRVETQTMATEESLPKGPRPGPELVWMPSALGSGESGEVLVVDKGDVGFKSSPVEFQIFFGYSPSSGRIAYGSQFWHAAQGTNQSVTDLWVYDYTEQQASLWLEDNVGRAIWSPSGGSGGSRSDLAVALFNPEFGFYELVLMESGGIEERIAVCASPSFSWSPDGSQIAYEAGGGIVTPSPPEACQGIYVITLADRSVKKISDQPPSMGGWHGDQPIWADGRESLLLTFASPESVFAVIPLDGAGAYTVTKSDRIAIEYLPNPLLSLWSREINSVVGQTEGMFDPYGVWVYRFSDDMRSVEDAYRITIAGQELDLILIDWWEPGVSVLLRDITNVSESNHFGRALIFTLEDRTWREAPGNS